MPYCLAIDIGASSGRLLEECGDAAESAANKAVEEFKALAINDTVSAALNKINGVQNKVDVSSENLIDKAERVQSTRLCLSGSS